ncbi:hypothetical protein Hanom_Chr11g01061811 [Helianthus anomalus]
MSTALEGETGIDLVSTRPKSMMDGVGGPEDPSRVVVSCPEKGDVAGGNLCLSQEAFTSYWRSV